MLESPKKLVSNLIKNYRKASGLTQQALAEKSKINLRHFQEIEGGKSDVRLSSIRKVSKQLHVPSCYLIQDSFDGDLAKISLGCKSEILDLLPIGIQINDLEGTIVYMNKHHQFRNSEVTKDKKGPFKIWDLQYDQSKKGELKEYLKYLVEEMPTPTPYRGANRGPAGEKVDLMVYWDYIKNQSGALIGFSSAIIELDKVLSMPRNNEGRA